MLSAGFADPVADSQAIFRTLMRALSRPGTCHTLPDKLAGSPLRPDMAALALALCDHETPVWLDPRLGALDRMATYLAFHAGCRVSKDKAEASFAFVADAADLPPFDQFAFGSDAYPDRSTTIIAGVSSLNGGRRWQATGPGIQGTISFAVMGLPQDFAARWAANLASFPRGIDLVLTDGSALLALPRSIQLQPEAEKLPCM